MAPIERDSPRDVERVPKHQHSASSDHGRLVPMWDSSDPERAPPPLPLNPQSPSVPSSRVGTSQAIQKAHAALGEKARESALVCQLAKRMSEVPSPTRNGSHRRMQSLQPGMTERPDTPSWNNNNNGSNRNGDPFVDERDEKALTRIVRPTARRPMNNSILGENTPPQSATMLALQNMATPSESDKVTPTQGTTTTTATTTELPLGNITNNGCSTALMRAPQSLESLSTQLLSLTNIATGLQKEMAALSRRSRDNATDLLSLKEATKTRDEDIRKSLRDLVTDARTRSSLPAVGFPSMSSQLLLEQGRAHSASPPSTVGKNNTTSTTRPFSLPRVPSPRSFAASFDTYTSSHDTMALLEKISGDMGTREGQELLLARLTELSGMLQGMASAIKVDELLRLVAEQAVVLAGDGGGRGNGNGNGNGNRHSRRWSFEEDDDQEATGRPRLLPAGQGEDVVKLIRAVKDSVAQGGGLTAEVKALVRELRGEVLGMGREIGRRMDDMHGGASKAEVDDVVTQALHDMKTHMDELLHDHLRRSGDPKEIQSALMRALNEAGLTADARLCREDIENAVRDAWEEYKPDIKVEHIGLDREEVLACLQAGLEEHAAATRAMADAATRDDVHAAVAEALEKFTPPRVETLSRDEMLDTVRECLSEFEFPVAAVPAKDDLVDEVVRRLDTFREEVSGLVASSTDGARDVVREEMETMRHVNKDSNMHVLTAVQDGLSSLRDDMSARADPSEMLDAIREGLDQVRTSIDTLHSKATEEVLDALRTGLESVRSDMDALRGDDKALTLARDVVPVVPVVPVLPADVLTHDDIEKLEVLITQLRIKVEAMDAGDSDEEAARTRAAMADMEAALGSVQATLAEFAVAKDKDAATRDDVVALEDILRNTKARLEDLADGEQAVRKDHVDAVEVLVRETGEVLAGLVDQVAGVASRTDLTAVETLVRHVEDCVERHATTTHGALEERQAELVGVAEAVAEARDLVDQVRSAVDGAREEGSASIASVRERLEKMDETVVSKVMDAVRPELEESRAGVVGAKISADEKFKLTTETITKRLDEGFDELRARHQQLDSVADERATKAELRDAATEDAVLGAKQVADELKTLVDTLGSTVTDSLEKMEEAGQTVYTRVEDLVLKTDDYAQADVTHHERTREAMVEGLEGLRAHQDELHPQVLAAVHDVLHAVDQQQEKVQEATRRMVQDVATGETYDDTVVRAKLDTLVGHAQDATTALGRLDQLDDLHTQVRQTAAELATFLESQTRRARQEDDDAASQLQATRESLAVARAEAEAARRVTDALRADEDEARARVAALQNETAALASQRSRMAADVAALETALTLRREELDLMEQRAEGLERRVREGVMEHARALLMGKAQRPAKDAAMNRKRVPSSSQKESSSAPPVLAPSPVGRPRKALQMAMAASPGPSSPAARRIFSLGPITGNVQAGGGVGVGVAQGGPMKRSHSVRTADGQGRLRKASWNGPEDKENRENETPREADEDQVVVGGRDNNHDDGETLCRIKSHEHHEDGHDHDGRSFYTETAVGVEEGEEEKEDALVPYAA